MFALELDYDQRKSLLTLLHKVSLIDNILCDKEITLLTEMKSYLGVNEDLNINIETNKLLHHFSDERSKRILLIDLVNIAYTDSDYSKKEQLLIQSISTELNVNNKTLLAIENWVELGRAWKKQGMLLLNET